MRRDIRWQGTMALLAGAALVLMVGCDSSSGGTLGGDDVVGGWDTGSGGNGKTDTGGGDNTPDTVDPQPDTVITPDSVTTPDGDTPDPDVVERPDVPSGPDVVLRPDTSGVDPNSVEAIQSADLGLRCDASVQFMNHEGTFTIEGLIVMSPAFKVTDTTNGYHVAEAAGPWHGIELQVPAEMDAGYQPGEVLTVTGQAIEYYCLTQLKASEAPVVTGHAPLPEPTDVQPETVGPRSSQAESYEGTLIRINNVHVYSTESWGFILNEGRVTIQDPLRTGVRPNRDCFIRSITGVLTYSFEEYKIIPLSADAIVVDEADHEACFAGAYATVAELQQADASAACDTFASIAKPDGGTGLEFAGLVVTTPKVYVSGNLRGYFLQDPTVEGGAWSGIQANFFKDEDPQLNMGDIVTVRGDWNEFHCVTQLATDTAADFEMTNRGDVPAPIAVDKALIVSDPAYAEQWEGVLVQVSDVVVATAPNDANHWQVTFEGGLQTEDFILYHYGDMALEPGTAFSTITGVLTGSSYDEGVYFIQPRVAEDMVLAQ